jgi:hypothetical protein
MRRCFLVAQLLLLTSLVGCPLDASDTGEECSRSLSDLKDLCPVGTRIEFEAEAQGSCGADGAYQPQSQSAELGGQCESMQGGVHRHQLDLRLRRQELLA